MLLHRWQLSAKSWISWHVRVAQPFHMAAHEEWRYQVKVAERAQRSDERFICAYPHFNVNEMLAVEELWEGAARDTDRPVIIFNGEIDRIRSGYYPALFYPKIGKLAKNMLPHVETIYYIHNFKGSGGGAAHLDL